jgi:hypothetical protein
MLAAAVILSQYVAAKGAAIQPQSSYPVYDGITNSRARWLLPTKASGTEADQLLGARANAALMANLSEMNIGYQITTGLTYQ